MPIPFTCPHCGARTDVAEEYAGQSGPCAHCGKTITVAREGAVPASAAPKRVSRLLVPAVVSVCVLGVAVVCGGVLLRLLMPRVQSARRAERQIQCAANLQQIATAVFAYRQRYDVFPPPCVADENGRPMHSWRVLILPFLGHRALYDQYDFSQPWDSSHNLALAGMIPDVYRCPDDPTGGNETSYLMIVGPGTFSTVTGPRQLGEFPDGAVNTLMLVETFHSGIRWTQPRDLDARQASFEINDPAGGIIRSRHPGGVNAAMCDGSVQFLSQWTAVEDVRAMTTIDGGEVFDPDRAVGENDGEDERLTPVAAPGGASRGRDG